MTPLKRPLPAGPCAPTLMQLTDDEQRLILHHLSDHHLAPVACVCRRLTSLVSDEMKERAKARAVERRMRRRERALAQARLARFEADARLLGTVLRHVLLHAPRPRDDDKQLPSESRPQQVHRLRVGICRDGHGVTMDESIACRWVNALAMQERDLRAIAFNGEPLGGAGAAVALRQARTIGLAEPTLTACDGRVFKLCIRGDKIAKYLAGSPTLARLVSLSEIEEPSPKPQKSQDAESMRSESTGCETDVR